MGFPDGIWQAAVGGFLLGATATAMLATTGKLIGLSGIFDGSISRSADRAWKAVFLFGFTTGGILVALIYPDGVGQEGAPSLPIVGFVISGLLVGLGTRLGNGCTSGHGLCGLPRLSRRSLVATLTFLTSGIATATAMSTWRTDSGQDASVQQESPSLGVRVAIVVLTAVSAAAVMRSREERANWRSHLASFWCGGTFAGSLVLSGMVKRAKVVDFLALRRNSWDPALAFVLGCGVATTLVGFPMVMRKLGAPVCRRSVAVVAAEDKTAATGKDEESKGRVTAAFATGGTFEIPTNTELDIPLILGAWLFGIGWGAGGLCPGPAFVAAAYGLPRPALAFLPALVVGMKAAGPLKRVVSLPDPSWVTGTPSVGA